MSRFYSAVLICHCLLSLFGASDAQANELEVNKNSNRGFVEGDIVLTAEQQAALEAEQAPDSTNHISPFGPQSLVVNFSRYTWPEGIVYYVFDSTVQAHRQTQDVIRAAFYEYGNRTCIRFQERTNQQDYVNFTKGAGCWSYIGRIGGPQTISIGFGCETKGVVIHEIFHALGRWHEQSRPDRDQYINIHTENIIPGAETNFEVVQTNRIISLQGIAYDISSIMHYFAYAFSRNGRPTITPKDSSININSFGQRNDFSDKDLLHVRTQYNCGTVQPATWSNWGSWTSCSRTCNGGTRTRTRTCEGGSNCVGSNIESQQCNTQNCPVIPSWSSWTTWGSCSASCGTGRQSRMRTCQNGNTCVGGNVQFRDCNTNACPQPATWSSWGSWTSCSQTCTGGYRERTRHCQNGNTCEGSSSEMQRCNEETPCTPDPSSGEWGPWTTCSATCGGGSRTRTRQCGLQDCQSQTEDCNTHACPDPLRGLRHVGCYAVPRTSQELLLLEGSTPELRDEPTGRSNPVEKCGMAALQYHYNAFSITLGFCISGSNSTNAYTQSTGFFCSNGRGGIFGSFLYMDVYKIDNLQAYSDALQEVLYSSTIVRPTPTATVATATVSPTVPVLNQDGEPNASFASIPSIIVLFTALIVGISLAVVL